MIGTMDRHNRHLIERIRNVNKALSLYVLALQEDMALTWDDHRGLARTLRTVAEAVEQEARKASPRDATTNHPVIQGPECRRGPDHPA